MVAVVSVVLSDAAVAVVVLGGVSVADVVDVVADDDQRDDVDEETHSK